MRKKYDFVIVGGGIVGLTVALNLAQRRAGSIAIFEKEEHTGVHASGRNSGVVHAGIYYPESSLKAKYCVAGHAKLIEFVEQESLPIRKCGKVIIATREENLATLDTLEARAKRTGAVVHRVDRQELKGLEPTAGGVGAALWSPTTAVVDSKAILARLEMRLRDLGVTFHFSETFTEVKESERTFSTNLAAYDFGVFINCGGAFADKIAHAFGVGLEYCILPFKGIYFETTRHFDLPIQRLIYPAPDIRMPFLGVHVTLTVDGRVLFGPTAIPALGRENYGLISGLSPRETATTSRRLLAMLWHNKNDLRRYVFEETTRYRRAAFFEEARQLVPQLKAEDLGGIYKVGIRSQLMNINTQALEMDFVLRQGPSSVHVLNAISPAFTSAMAFAPDLADRALALS